MKRRNCLLDIVKLIASFFVVFIHVTFPGTFGQSIRSFSGFAVPLFFITSGYFSREIIDAKNYKKLFSRIKSLCLIFLIAIVSYSFVYIIINGLNSYINYFMIKDTYIKLLAFNSFENTFFTPLWFLLALIYVYAVIIVLLKIKLEKLIIALPCLFLPLILLSGFNGIKYEISNILYSNFLITGIPYFSVGYILKNKVSSISKQGLKINNALFVFNVLLFAFLYVRLSNIFHISSITNIIIAITLFIISVSYRVELSNNKVGFIISKLSLYIYILHWLVYNLMSTYIPLKINMWVYPIIVLLISMFISLLLILIIHRKKIFYIKK